MTRGTTTGVRNPDQPDRWLVPPWPAGADFHAVVRHFIMRWPWLGSNPTHLRAYYEGFQAALDDAPTGEHPSAGEARWYAEMRDCLDRCLRHYRPAPATEIHRAA